MDTQRGVCSALLRKVQGGAIYSTVLYYWAKLIMGLRGAPIQKLLPKHLHNGIEVTN
jgi:hypothetical protein